MRDTGDTGGKNMGTEYTREEPREGVREGARGGENASSDTAPGRGGLGSPLFTWLPAPLLWVTGEMLFSPSYLCRSATVGSHPLSPDSPALAAWKQKQEGVEVSSHTHLSPVQSLKLPVPPNMKARGIGGLKGGRGTPVTLAG